MTSACVYDCVYACVHVRINMPARAVKAPHLQTAFQRLRKCFCLLPGPGYESCKRNIEEETKQLRRQDNHPPRHATANREKPGKISPVVNLCLTDEFQAFSILLAPMLI